MQNLNTQRGFRLMNSHFQPQEFRWPFAIKGYGSSHTLKDIPDGRYDEIASFEELCAVALNPPTGVEKSKAAWAMFTTFNGQYARNREPQLTNGRVTALVADFDHGDHTQAAVVAVLRKVCPSSAFTVYHSNSTGGVRDDGTVVEKHKAVIKMEGAYGKLPTGLYHKPIHRALNDMLEELGFEMDRSTESITQPCYLPNPGLRYDAPHIEPASWSDPDQHSAIVLRANELYHLQCEELAVRSRNGQAKLYGLHSPIGAFNLKHTADEMLGLHGFRYNGENSKGSEYGHPSQSMGDRSKSTLVYPDGGISTRSDTVAKLLGVTIDKAFDAFDIYTNKEHGGDTKKALAYANLCLSERLNAVYGAATVVHGRYIVKQLFDCAAAKKQVIQEAMESGMVKGNQLSNDGDDGVYDHMLPFGTTLMSAAPKAGKSWLALNVSTCVALGAPLFGDPQFPMIGDAGDVLYFALEDNQRNTFKRLDAMQVPEKARERITFKFQAYEDGVNPTLDGSLQSMCNKWVEGAANPKLIVIDVLQNVRTERGKRELVGHDRDDMGVLNALGFKYDVAVLVVHHDRKNAGGDMVHKASGSFGIVGSTFANWQVSKANKGIKLETFGRVIRADDYLLRASHPRTFVYQIQNKAAKLSDQEARVLLAAVELNLSHSLITAKMLEEQLSYEVPVQSIRVVLSRLFGKGIVTRTKTKGVYELNHAQMVVIDAIELHCIDNNLPIIKLGGLV
jgi:hypothetical protein